MSDPVVEKTTTGATETVTASTEASAAAIISPVPAAAADDNVRKIVAQEAIFTDFILAIAILYLLFYKGETVPAFTAGIIGTIVGYKARDVGTVYGYLFGSSSGSTAKSVQLEKK